MSLGWAALREDSYDEASVLFMESMLLAKGLIVAREGEALLTIYQALVGLATLNDTLLAKERAAFLFGAAETLALRRFLMAPAWQEELESEIKAAHDRLGGETWDKAWAEGAVITVEEAIAFAAGDETHKADTT